MGESRRESIRTNHIKVMPMKGLIIIEPLMILSIYEEQSKSKNIILTDSQIIEYNKHILETQKDATKVWSQHPYQGIVVALTEDDAKTYQLRVNDRIGYVYSDHTGILIIYNKKRYIALRPGEIICRYLTETR
jgi:hypothetical protein